MLYLVFFLLDLGVVVCSQNCLTQADYSRVYTDICVYGCVGHTVKIVSNISLSFWKEIVTNKYELKKRYYKYLFGIAIINKTNDSWLL